MEELSGAGRTRPGLCHLLTDISLRSLVRPKSILHLSGLLDHESLLNQHFSAFDHIQITWESSYSEDSYPVDLGSGLRVCIFRKLSHVVLQMLVVYSHTLSSRILTIKPLLLET